LEGPAAIIGDFNAVGPVGFQGFSDIGPRTRTHRAGNIIALRLDRCIARGLICSASEVLDKGPSDHHPMVLDMAVDMAFHTPGLEDSALFAL
jgi:endonuclease/exonuclease/phosphatase family metal-dependent hydrolase